MPQDSLPENRNPTKRLQSLAPYLLLVSIAVSTISQAARKPFWYDEILTLTIARLPVGPEMWSAMLQGFDLNPPLLNVATHVAGALLGEGALSSRLAVIIPGLSGFVLGMLIVGRHSSGNARAWFLLLLIVSPWRDYLLELRTYALVLCGMMLAWWFWQRLKDGCGPLWLNRGGILAGLGIAVGSHFWALVIPPCFLAAETWRCWRAGTVRRSALGAILIGCLIPALWLPLVQSSLGLKLDNIVFGQGPAPAVIVSIYLFAIGVELLFAAAMAILLIAPSFFRRSGENRASDGKFGVPPEEALLAMLLICAPLGIATVGFITHSPVMARYALVAAVGAAYLLAHLLEHAGSGTPVVASLLIGVLTAGLWYSSFRTLRGPWQPELPSEIRLEEVAAQGGPSEPIVFTNGLQFLMADYYVAPEIARRLVYATDRELAVKFSGTDAVDAGFILGHRHLRLRGQVMSYAALTSRYPTFVLVWDEVQSLNWISEKVRADGARIEALPLPGKRASRVSMPVSVRTASQ